MRTASRLLVVFSAAVASALPAQTTPLRIEQTVEPQFPSTLAQSHCTTGEARVIINVDADGKLVDWLVTGYTDKAFADEAVQVLKAWRYTAPRENGQPIGVRTELRFDFEAKGRIVSLMAIETADVLFQQITGSPSLISRICHLRELDQPLTPVDPATPRHPAEAGASARPRSVMIDFYVDEQGQPRMPVVINAAQPQFALAAMDALSRWRFTAPTRAGKPVSVRVRQEFIFPGSS